MVFYPGSWKIMMFSVLQKGANLTLYVISSCMKQQTKHLVSGFYVSRYRSTLCHYIQTRVPITDKQQQQQQTLSSRHATEF